MSKNFQEWHTQKNDLHENNIRVFFHEREVWFTSLGANIGFEQDGKGKEFLRPIIIVKKFNNEILWMVPTTKRNKKGKYYFTFSYNEEDEHTTAIISQLRLIDSKRLKYKIGIINEEDFVEMKKRIISLLK